MQQRRKVALIDVHDYRAHSAWYEIMVTGDDAEGYHWRLRIYSKAPGGGVLEEYLDACLSRDEADTAAQMKALTEMEKYRP